MTTTTTSKPYPFTLEQVLEATRTLVEEKGEDFVYSPVDGFAGGDCVYAVDGNPSCLVGHVIFRLDAEAFKHLAELERERGSVAAADLVGGGYLRQSFWTSDAAMAMQEAQATQDEGLPWGRALYEAENLGADAD